MNSSNLIVDITLLGLVFLSVVTWSVAILKYIAFRKELEQSKSFLAQYAAVRNWGHGCQVAKEHSSLDAQLVQLGTVTCHELIGAEGDGYGAHDLQEIVERQLRKRIQQQIREREKGLAELASIGSTAPFIGLFGTVWGIMNALKTITASGQASIDVVAGPIGEALIATAIGIATAIPAVLIYNYFLRLQRVRVTQLDGFVDDFLRRAMRCRKDWGASC